jgi:hypothetical protein
MYFISDQEVKRFVTTYPTQFDLRRVEQVWLIDLLAGIRR